MSNLDKFDPDLLDDEQEFEEDEDAVRAAEAELAARDKREGREKVTYQNQAVQWQESSCCCALVRFDVKKPEMVPQCISTFDGLIELNLLSIWFPGACSPQKATRCL